jgi:hypothetical protein
VSYDLFMLAPEEGVKPQDQLERFDAEERESGSDPAIEERKRRIAEALKQADARYDESIFDYERIAEMDGTSVEEARSRNRNIQLMAEGGLEINLYDHHADFNFPYWDSLDVETLMGDIERAATIIAAETGWKLYDPAARSLHRPRRGRVRGSRDVRPRA